MNKLSFKDQVNLMNRIANNERNGNMNFSHADGGDMYVDESNLIGDNYDGYEYGDSYSGGQKSRPGTINAPQRVLSINLTNSTGTAATTIVHAAQDIYVALFGATTASLPGVPSLNVCAPTANTPATAATLNVTIDGVFYQNTSTVSGTDLTVTGSPASYRQLLGESLTSPFEVTGLRIASASSLQLQTDYTVNEVDIIGSSKNSPYTAADKISPFQYLQTIIVDANFRMKVNGNNSLLYTVLGPVNAGLGSTTPNQVKILFYLYKQVEAGRALAGKNTVISARSRQMPGASPFKVIN